MKTAKFIEETKTANSVSSPEKTAKRDPKANLVAPWPKGVSGNPGGRPKTDLAAEIARAVFTENKEAIYKAMAKALLKGNAYSFDVVANRGYGKLKEPKEVTHIYQDVADADLNGRIAELERELGLAGEIDEAGRIGIAQAREESADIKAEDSNLLPR